MLHLGERVVDLIGPSATDRIDAKATEIARRGGDTPAVVVFATQAVIGIDVTGDHLTAGGEEEGIVVFGNIAQGVAAVFNHRYIVGADDGQSDGFSRLAIV
ncbi:hypothetical protein SIN8267_00002 [Sinobacterium norvegicum]|uniref:FIST domain-containing protein n=1 Tax=Sinobacterium norvegicum TaxID=1641715 RepID=A0ABM9AAN2_9GAMM|nr:hypothetical protein SIN8267_00002 [Sinobacterium norvegicum]